MRTIPLMWSDLNGQLQVAPELFLSKIYDLPAGVVYPEIPEEPPILTR